MKKRILQVSTCVFRYDGLSKVILSLIDNCPCNNSEVYVLLGKGAILEFYKELDNRNIRYFEGPDREKDLIGYSIYLYNLLKKGKFDIIHVHGNSATMTIEMTIAKICGIKTRITHCHNTVTNHPVIHSLLKPILNILVTSPVACGKDAGEFLYNREFKIIPNCIDVSKYEYNQEIRNSVRNELKCKNEILIGHVGRFTYQKNHKLLIKIFYEIQKEIGDSKLLLIGEGELQDEIKKLVSTLNIKDKVLFYGTADNVNELMQAMDVFILPSRYEGLCITAIEAQAAGLPCLMTNTISRDTKISSNCQFIDINAPIKTWINAVKYIINDNRDRRIGAKEVRENNYDVAKLKEIIEKIWNV